MGPSTWEAKKESCLAWAILGDLVSKKSKQEAREIAPVIGFFKVKGIKGWLHKHKDLNPQFSCKR